MSLVKSDIATRSDENLDPLSKSAPPQTVAAIVVTHNRLALLQECVAALRGQTRPPEEIIVVDNGSTDGTADWLATQSDVTVVTQGNEGSSGGQYTGIKTAYQNGHYWFWCMDDDTVPRPDALERLSEVPAFRELDTGYLSSVVLWTDGKPWGDTHNQASNCSEWFLTVMQDGCVRTQASTFVSCMFSRPAVVAVGLPYRPFFILVDDTEYTQRVTKAGYKGYYVLNSFAVHKTAVCTRTTPQAYSKRDWKHRYWIRNRVILSRMTWAGTWFGLCLHMTSSFGRLLIDILRGRESPATTAWFARGLLLSTRIDRV